MALRTKPYTIRVYGASDIGLVRENNEDAWHADPKKNIFVLADGMGGHSAGEVAAQEAISNFCSLLPEILPPKETRSLEETVEAVEMLIRLVNGAIYSLAQKDRELRGMGTTFCCVYFWENKMIVGHVGDSRVYRYADRRLQQVTEDHSLMSELLELGELSARQARDYAYKHIITKAIGAEPEVEPEINIVEIDEKDQVLMCSDGLSDLLSLESMEQILSKDLSLEDSVRMLIEGANKKGGQDNITAVLMHVARKNEKKDLS